MKKGFTMIEMVMVIVVIGILSAVALPKLMGTRGIAMIAQGKSALYSVRGALSAEKQNRFMNSDTTPITSLGDGTHVFSIFSPDGDTVPVSNKVMEYPVKSCTDIGCWSGGTGTSYTFYLPEGGTCTYKIVDSSLVVDGTCPEFGDN